ncbi:DUF1800 domain-containing protein [Flammeovirga sp. MY04]|uniref:DUF1800 domain-containing protein n=1 Tax=Flammeovirga sp. MY04 TaxID=1191459 RepID=UPI0008063372|nr:DUF1800 domain-containing protein [Flammeovirga sp. MY04]ANQ49133.1 DUF1800 domain-containing protein [Flammeovirga sp. MY04]
MKKDYRKLLHLYSRAGFGINKKEADEVVNNKDWITPLTSIKNPELLKFDLPEFSSNYMQMSADEKMDMRKEMRKLSRDINIHWIDQMSTGKDPLIEKMTLFWHGHFACRIVNPYNAVQYTNVLRSNSLGSFKTLVTEVAKSAAMIKYLHLRQNKKKSPNEDFARELCELFTLGRDQEYTENDVKEIARAFTGWSNKKDGTYRFNERQHDKGEKTIFGKTGNFGGDDVIEMILEKKQCARFICQKIYKEFVHPDINEKHLEEITSVFYNNNYDISILMHHIFTSKWFYSNDVIGAKIKSPIELIVGLKRTFDLQPKSERVWLILQRNLGQELYFPPNVAGWPGDTTWIDSSRLAMRLRLPSILLNNGIIPIAFKEDYDVNPNENKRKMKKLGKFQGDIKWSNVEGLHQEEEKKCTLANIMIRGELSDDAQNYLDQHQLSSFKDRMIQLLSLPEYQLC